MKSIKELKEGKKHIFYHKYPKDVVPLSNLIINVGDLNLNPGFFFAHHHE